MKKALLVIAFILILAAIPVTILLVQQRQEIRQQAAPATTMFLEPSAPTVDVGQTFTLDVVVDTQNLNNVGAAEINLTYNPLYLEAVSLQVGSFLPYVLVDGTVGNGTASITVGVNPQDPSQANGATGRGTAAVLTLRALQSTGGTPTVVQFASTSQIAGSNEEDRGTNVLIGTQPAQVTVSGGAAASPTPSPGTASPTPQPSSTPGSASPTPLPSATTQITAPTNGATVTTRRPTISGTSPASASVTVSINTSPITSGTTTASTLGAWSYTPTADLANGTYTVTATADDGVNSPQTVTSTFTVSVSGTGGTGTASPSPSASTSTTTASPSPAASTTTATGGTGGTQTKGGENVPVTGTSAPTVILLLAAIGLLIFGTKALVFTKE